MTLEELAAPNKPLWTMPESAVAAYAVMRALESAGYTLADRYGLTSVDTQLHQLEGVYRSGHGVVIMIARKKGYDLTTTEHRHSLAGEYVSPETLVTRYLMPNQF